MDAKTANGTANKAYALKQVFPDRLPENFAQSFDPKKLPHVVKVLGSSDTGIAGGCQLNYHINTNDNLDFTSFWGTGFSK